MIDCDIRGQGPREVREIEHTLIPLKDGTRLAARIWLPEDAEADPVPAILEYLPYRKSDGTTSRDRQRYAYLAGHGLAGVRVDIRGSGESDGLLTDEYTRQEQDDALEAIEWIAAQPWCTGAVGMQGISWGGFNSLQVAARRPPALKAVIAMMAADDRYADDVHYRGGCVLATDMLHWGTSMMTWQGRPPDPALVGEGWREMWMERLEHAVPFTETWLSHQARDDYWKWGSVCEDFSRIEAAVYAVGGWVDGYTNAVPRLLAGLPGPKKGLIGPWSHCFPEDSVPGPSIGFLQETRRWFDHWLRGEQNGIMEEPQVRLWLQEQAAPEPMYRERAGRWIAEPRWPPPNVAPRQWSLGAGGTLDEVAGPQAALEIRGLQAAGLDAGVWCSEGQAADLAPDQRAEDGMGLSFTSAPLAEPLELVGFGEAELELASDRPLALCCVRLCDVAPDGTSLLVTRGLLNLTHRRSHERPEPLQPGRRERVRVELDAIAQTIPAGHRLRVSVTPTYWPWAWPSPEPVTLTLWSGASAVRLPLRDPAAGDGEPQPFGAPECAPGAAVETLRGGTEGRRLVRDPATGRNDLVFDWNLGGRYRIPDTGLESEDANRCVYSIAEGDPLSARVTVEATTAMARGGWGVRIETRASMTSDADSFRVTTVLDAYEGEVRVFSRSWDFATPRNLV